jgi:tight adherence protein B
VSATVPKALAGRDTQLEVTATVDGTTASTSVPVTFDIDPTAATQKQTFAAQQPDIVWYAVIGVLVFLALLAFALVLFAPLIDFTRHRRRLSQVDAFRVRTPVPAGAPASRAIAPGGWEARTAERLDLAGLRMSPSTWLAVRFGIAAGVAVLAALLFGPFVAVLLGPVVGWLAPRLWLGDRVSRRQRRFAAALPDALQLIIGSLRSGFSLSQAVDAMVREAAEPLATEFTRALAETRLGAELEDALTRVATRMGSKDLGWAVVAIRVQREVGGNLAEVLSTTVTTMREREALRRHVQGLAAEGKLSAYILVALPILVTLVMLVTRPSYLAPLVTSAIGWAMLLGGAVLMVLGTLWMSRMVKVEV